MAMLGSAAVHPWAYCRHKAPQAARPTRHSSLSAITADGAIHILRLTVARICASTSTPEPPSRDALPAPADEAASSSFAEVLLPK